MSNLYDEMLMKFFSRRTTCAIGLMLMVSPLTITGVQAEHAVRLQALVGSAFIFDQGQHISIDDPNIPSSRNNFPDKRATGMMFEWAPAATQGQLGHAVAIDYYNLRETEDFCIKVTNSNCYPHGTQLENWFLGYRYHFRGGLYLGLNIGFSGKMERTQYLRNSGQRSDRVTTNRNGFSPYGITLGYTYQEPNTGATLGFNYAYSARGEYEFDRYCIENLNSGETSCSNEPAEDLHEKPIEAYHHGVSFTLGWTWQ